MGMIDTLLLGLGGIVGTIMLSAAGRQAADEFKAWTPSLVSWLHRSAVAQLEDDVRERWAEEWSSHLVDTPGDVGKIIAAVGFLIAGRSLRAPKVAPLSWRIICDPTFALAKRIYVGAALVGLDGLAEKDLRLVEVLAMDPPPTECELLDKMMSFSMDIPTMNLWIATALFVIAKLFGSTFGGRPGLRSLLVLGPKVMDDTYLVTLARHCLKRKDKLQIAV